MESWKEERSKAGENVDKLTPVPELQGTTQEVAKAKCAAAAKALNAACVTEDTALCFEALGGLPGPYIKDFLGTVGHDGKYSLPSSPLRPSTHPFSPVGHTYVKMMLEGTPSQLCDLVASS